MSLQNGKSLLSVKTFFDSPLAFSLIGSGSIIKGCVKVN